MPPFLDFGTHRWTWARPYILGILNVTPDSFSDGGCHETTELAVAKGTALLAEGADALDIGGESTRPGAPPVSEEEELRRVLPVVEALAAKGCLLSIDTTKPAVAERCLAAGAKVLNDVGTGASARDLGAIARRHGAAYIAMHSRGAPGDMQERSAYVSLQREVQTELLDRVEELRGVGLGRERILLDPGIGFAKKPEHSLQLVAELEAWQQHGYALCVGVSRKSFLAPGRLYGPAWDTHVETGQRPNERLGATAAAVTFAVLAGAQVLRVHDVAVMRQAARFAMAVRDKGWRTDRGGSA